MGTLYVVATPIGNLEDVTQRAINVLRSIPLVIAEDSRVTRKLIQRLDISPRLVSYHAYTTPGKMREILRLLDGNDAALVTDAGTPGINDPGADLVAAAAERGHHIVPLPGPSSIATALSASGFSADRFKSLGFIPSKPGTRRRVIQEVSDDPMTIVFLETPHRIRETLATMSNLLGDRQIVVCREMTKVHEEIWRGTSAEALEHFSETRGEFVIVVAPRAGGKTSGTSVTDAEILSIASKMSEEATSKRDLAHAVSKRTGAGRRRVYQLLHQPESSDR